MAVLPDLLRVQSETLGMLNVAETGNAERQQVALSSASVLAPTVEQDMLETAIAAVSSTLQSPNVACVPVNIVRMQLVERPVAHLNP